MEEEKKEELNENNEVENNIEEIKEDFFDGDLNDKKTKSKSSMVFLVIFLLIIVIGLIYRLFFDNSNREQPKDDNLTENNQEQIISNTNEYDDLVNKGVIVDSVGNYTVYATNSNNEKEYSIVDNLKKEIVIKTKYIISNSKYKSDVSNTREYILVSNDVLKVYSINNEIKEEEITNELYERLIDERIINKAQLDMNSVFTYSGTDFIGEQLVIIFDNGCDYYDEIDKKNHFGVAIIFVINKDTNQVKRLNPNLIETNSDICPYEDDDINMYDKLKPNSLENYTINDKKIINKKTNEEYDIYMGFIDSTNEESNYLYVISKDNLKGIYNKKEGYIIEPMYTDVSCVDHSLEAFNICEKSYTTLIDGSKLISLRTGEIIVDASRMNELSNGNFIAKIDNKDAVYTSEGNKLFESGYIGYEKSIGYIAIDNAKYTIYNEKFEKTTLPSIEEEKRIKTYDYNMWIPGDLLLKVNVKDNEYFEYNDDKYEGEQIIFIKVECGEDDSIYVFENNKLDKLEKTKIKEDSNTCI